MSHSIIPLQDLEQRINQRQVELEQLRREYEARHGQLQKLAQRQQQLQAQLQQVEAEIASFGQGPASATKPAKVTKPPRATTTRAAPPKGTVATLSLSKLLVQIVRAAKRPITIKELATEVVRRHYPSTSKNLPKTVETRVSELVKKGLLRRAPNQAGVLPAGTPSSAKTPSPAKVGVSKPATAAAAPAPELTLAAAVTKVLAASAKPLTARTLADKVLALGYRSKSQDFLNVLGAGLSKMNTVEHVQGQGYRLKKGKTSPAASKRHNSK
jgi:hypothetical protein